MNAIGALGNGIGEKGAPTTGDLSVTAAREQWPLVDEFRIARAVKRVADVVVVTVGDGMHSGRGEYAPHSRDGESIESVRRKYLRRSSELAGMGITQQEPWPTGFRMKIDY